jgi:RNA-directed DNA polymerase
MKRINDIYQQVYEWDNLLEAYRKARKGSSHSRDAILYSLDLHRNLANLQQLLVDGKAEVGNYHYFTIFDPKERIICAAPFGERVLHHAVMNVFGKRLEQHLIHDTYACRKGKGTERALLKAFDNTADTAWFLKLDMRKYFDSIDHDILKCKLRRVCKDRDLLRLLDQIIDSYCVSAGKGIPIGNLTSQHFANFYLSFFDHHVKDVLRIKWYVRYMDDCILWASTKEELIACKKELTGYLESELRLTLKYSVINKTCSGVPFLGFLLKPDRILVLRSKKKRLHRTWKELYWQLRTDMIDQQLFADRISASLSHLRIARSRMFVYNFLQRYDFRLEPGPSGR